MTAVGVGSPFIVTIIVDIIEVVGVLFSFLLVNRFGRRPLLIYTSAFMAAVLLICGALGATDFKDHPPMQKAIAAMIILYVFAFNLAWGPLVSIVAPAGLFFLSFPLPRNFSAIRGFGSWLSLARPDRPDGGQARDSSKVCIVDVVADIWGGVRFVPGSNRHG